MPLYLLTLRLHGLILAFSQKRIPESTWLGEAVLYRRTRQSRKARNAIELKPRRARNWNVMLGSRHRRRTLRKSKQTVFFLSPSSMKYRNAFTVVKQYTISVVDWVWHIITSVRILIFGFLQNQTNEWLFPICVFFSKKKHAFNGTKASKRASRSICLRQTIATAFTPSISPMLQQRRIYFFRIKEKSMLYESAQELVTASFPLFVSLYIQLLSVNFRLCSFLLVRELLQYESV